MLDPFVHHLRDEPVPPCDESEASSAQSKYRSPSPALLERLGADQRSSFLLRTPCRHTCAKSRLICTDFVGRQPSSPSQAKSWLSSRTCFRSPQQTSAPSPCFPSRFRFLRTALPLHLGPTASIFRPPSKWTRFWTDSSLRASSNIPHRHGRAQWWSPRKKSGGIRITVNEISHTPVPASLP